jgi:hypothetical protein
MESILIWCACVVRYLQLCLFTGGVMVEVDIAAAIKAMVLRLRGRVGEVVMDIGEATLSQLMSRR